MSNIYYNDFLSVIQEDVLDNILYFNKYMVNYFYKYRNQKVMNTIDSSISISDDIKIGFNGFCINFGTGFSSVNKYIVFIGSKEKGIGDPIEEFRANIIKYLPDGKQPTHVCIVSDDIAEVESVYSILLKDYPNLVLVQQTKVYNFSERRLENAKALLGNKYELLLISDYCEELETYYKESSLNFIKEYERVVDEIYSKCAGKFILFGGDYQSFSYQIFQYILAELYVRDAKCKFYVESEDSATVLSTISKTVFNPECMLVEDVVKFLLSLPTLSAEIRQDCLLFHLINNRTLYLPTSYVPMSSISRHKVENKKLNASTIQIVPFSNHFDMESDDFYKNIRAEHACREFIHNLYNVFEVPNDKILSVTNIFFFIKDNVEYVGYCRDYDYAATCISNMSGMDMSPMTLDFDHVRKLSYIDCCLDSTKIITSFKMLSPNKALNRKSVIPVKTFRNYSPIYSIYNINNDYHYFDSAPSEITSDKYWTDMPHSVFNCGMYSPMSVRFRTGLYMSLMKHLGVDKVRGMLDSFGGFNLVTNPTLELTMERKS